MRDAVRGFALGLTFLVMSGLLLFLISSALEFSVVMRTLAEYKEPIGIVLAIYMGLSAAGFIATVEARYLALGCLMHAAVMQTGLLLYC
jgi:hypothetical protein